MINISIVAHIQTVCITRLVKWTYLENSYNFLIKNSSVYCINNFQEVN
jgi:hypothetical protein